MAQIGFSNSSACRPKVLVKKRAEVLPVNGKEARRDVEATSLAALAGKESGTTPAENRPQSSIEAEESPESSVQGKRAVAGAGDVRGGAQGASVKGKVAGGRTGGPVDGDRSSRIGASGGGVGLGIGYESTSDEESG
jgi:hypothetical protein